MQVTETLSQGLKREYNVVVSAGDLASKLDTQLADLKNKVRINGFRPGKVPVAPSQARLRPLGHGRRRARDDHGRQQADRGRQWSASGDGAQDRAADRARRDRRGARGARRSEFQGGAGSAAAVRNRRFLRHRARAPGRRRRGLHVESGLERLADSRRLTIDRPAGEKAEKGDRVTVDFVGTIEGEPFEGGTSQDIEVVLGSKTFIPGFEEALIGVVAGEQRKVQATFPENYAVARPRRQDRRFRRRR